MKIRIVSTLIVGVIAFLFVAIQPVMANEPAVKFGGGGEYVIGDEITARERAEIEAAIGANRAMLSAQGRRSIDPSRTVLLASPLERLSDSAENNFYAIYNFVDLNSAYPDQHTDYHCGDRSYDSDSGYNHQGIDYFLWPFAWNKMDNDEVAVVAAANGQIIHKTDGQFDRSCTFGGRWNAVYVEHADGSLAWYGHLKSGSVITKPVGAIVQTGEQLGIVGSSGSSTGPHLHFELHDHNGDVIEPNAGTCNSTTHTAWWIEQEPYYNPTLVSVMSGDAPIEMSCSHSELLHQRDVFPQNAEVFLTTFYRDQQRSLPSTYRLIRPDGTIFDEWEHTIWDDYYAASWWYWSADLDDQVGTWRFEVEFAGQQIAHSFDVGIATAVTEVAIATQQSSMTIMLLLAISALLMITCGRRNFGKL